MLTLIFKLEFIILSVSAAIVEFLINLYLGTAYLVFEPLKHAVTGETQKIRIPSNSFFQ